MDKILLGSVIAQLFLTFTLMFMMGIARINAVKSKQVRISEIALATDKYPTKARQIANAFANQFQMPTLFYFGVVLCLIYGQISWIEITLAYSFVIMRFVHAFIHIGKNNPVQRLNAYLVGVLLLMAFLISVFLKIIL